MTPSMNSIKESCASSTDRSFDVLRLARLGLYDTIEIKHNGYLYWAEKINDYATMHIKHWILLYNYKHGKTSTVADVVYYREIDGYWDMSPIIISQITYITPLPRRKPFDNIK